jgi:hypothetical protein
MSDECQLVSVRNTQRTILQLSMCLHLQMKNHNKASLFPLRDAITSRLYDMRGLVKWNATQQTFLSGILKSFYYCEFHNEIPCLSAKSCMPISLGAPSTRSSAKTEKPRNRDGKIHRKLQNVHVFWELLKMVIQPSSELTNFRDAYETLEQQYAQMDQDLKKSESLNKAALSGKEGKEGLAALTKGYKNQENEMQATIDQQATELEQRGTPSTDQVLIANEMKSLEVKIIAMQETIAESDQEKQILRDTIKTTAEEHSRDIKKLNLSLKEDRDLMNRLNANVLAQQDHITANESERVVLLASISSLKLQIKEGETEVKAAASAQRKLQLAYDDRITEMKKEDLAARDKVYQKQQDEVMQLDKDHATALQAKISSYETQIKNINDEHRKEIQELKDQIKEAQKASDLQFQSSVNVDDYEKSLATLKQKLAEEETKHGKVLADKEEAHQNELLQLNNEHQEELVRMKEAHTQESARYAQENDSLQAEIIRLTASVGREKQDAEFYEKQEEKSMQLITDLQEELRLQTAQATTLKDQAQKYEERAKRAETLLERVNDRIAALQGEVAAAGQEVENLNIQLEETDNAKSQQEAGAVECQKELEKTKTDYSVMREYYNKKCIDLVNLQKEFDELNAGAVEWKRKFEELRELKEQDGVTSEASVAQAAVNATEVTQKLAVSEQKLQKAMAQLVTAEQTAVIHAEALAVSEEKVSEAGAQLVAATKTLSTEREQAAAKAADDAEILAESQDMFHEAAAELDVVKARFYTEMEAAAAQVVEVKAQDALALETMKEEKDAEAIVLVKQAHEQDKASIEKFRALLIKYHTEGRVVISSYLDHTTNFVTEYRMIVHRMESLPSLSTENQQSYKSLTKHLTLCYKNEERRRLYFEKYCQDADIKSIVGFHTQVVQILEAIRSTDLEHIKTMTLCDFAMSEEQTVRNNTILHFVNTPHSKDVFNRLELASITPLDQLFYSMARHKLCCKITVEQLDSVKMAHKAEYSRMKLENSCILPCTTVLETQERLSAFWVPTVVNMLDFTCG